MENGDEHRHILLAELISLETELHKQATRQDQRRMEALLHPEFMEFGRSGTRYTRAEIVGEFEEGNVLPLVQSRDFQLAVLTEGVALLTYVSAHVDTAGHAHRQTLRSSIWVRTEVAWQIRFHQGTPISLK